MLQKHTRTRLSGRGTGACSVRGGGMRGRWGATGGRDEFVRKWSCGVTRGIDGGDGRDGTVRQKERGWHPVKQWGRVGDNGDNDDPFMSGYCQNKENTFPRNSAADNDNVKDNDDGSEDDDDAIMNRFRKNRGEGPRRRTLATNTTRTMTSIATTMAARARGEYQIRIIAIESIRCV